MVDYSFMEDAAENEPGISGKVPESHAEAGRYDGPQTRTLGPVEKAKTELNRYNGQFAMMINEADEFEITDNVSFERSVEMRGQLKTFSKMLEDLRDKHAKPHYQIYRSIRNFFSTYVDKLAAADGGLAKKSNAYAHELEMQRRRKEAKAREEAAKLQAKLDKMQAEQEAKERAAAKKEKREAVIQPPITVDAPVVPKEIKAKTEHGSVKVKMVLKHEITELESEFIHGLILANCRAAYKTLADTAIKKAIKAGALGLKGGPGVNVFEEAEAAHRRR